MDCWVSNNDQLCNFFLNWLVATFRARRNPVSEYNLCLTQLRLGGRPVTWCSSSDGRSLLWLTVPISLWSGRQYHHGCQSLWSPILSAATSSTSSRSGWALKHYGCSYLNGSEDHLPSLQSPKGCRHHQKKQQYHNQHPRQNVSDESPSLWLEGNQSLRRRRHSGD